MYGILQYCSFFLDLKFVLFRLLLLFFLLLKQALFLNLEQNEPRVPIKLFSQKKCNYTTTLEQICK